MGNVFHFSHVASDENIIENELNSVRMKRRIGNRERESERWALCQGARCPRSEPLLFTGRPLIPVRELSASEMIWAALLSLCCDRDDPTRPQHNVSTLSVSVDLFFPHFNPRPASSVHMCSIFILFCAIKDLVWTSVFQCLYNTNLWSAIDTVLFEVDGTLKKKTS